VTATFNVRELTHLIKDKDEGSEDLRENHLQRGRLMRSKLNNATSLMTLKP